MKKFKIVKLVKDGKKAWGLRSGDIIPTHDAYYRTREEARKAADELNSSVPKCERCGKYPANCDCK